MALAFSSAPSRLSSSSASLTNRSAFSSSRNLALSGKQTFNGVFSHFSSIRPSKLSHVAKAVSEETDTDDPPAPDLPSYFFQNRIVYIGMPLIRSVMELLLAELIHLQTYDQNKPIYLYINSTGVVKNDPRLGYETEAFSLYGMMRHIKAPVYTLCVGNAYGEAALLLASGERGHRAALPSAKIMIKQPIYRLEGRVADINVAKEQTRDMKDFMVNTLSKHTGQTKEKIEEDTKQPKYFTAEEAVEYGLIDKVLYNLESHDVDGVLSQL